MKQSPLIQIKNLHVSISFVSASASGDLLSPDREAFYAESIKSGGASITPPAIGAYWPGQGGINGGLRPSIDGVAEHYLIIAAKDVGDHEWGGRGKESGATSKWNGKANTAALLAEGNHPAAKAASEHTADGHTDFYLPSAAENHHCWVHASGVFAKDTWYWSSSQRSADSAFFQYFGVGYQDSHGKLIELRVRPVRRLFI